MKTSPPCGLLRSAWRDLDACREHGLLPPQRTTAAAPRARRWEGRVAAPSLARKPKGLVRAADTGTGDAGRLAHRNCKLCSKPIQILARISGGLRLCGFCPFASPGLHLHRDQLIETTATLPPFIFALVASVRSEPVSPILQAKGRERRMHELAFDAYAALPSASSDQIHSHHPQRVECAAWHLPMQGPSACMRPAASRPSPSAAAETRQTQSQKPPIAPPGLQPQP
jgi:hypothetical protein